MTEGTLSRAQVWLAVASALIVLLASGVAVSRISGRDDGHAASRSLTTGSVPAVGQGGSTTSSGPASAAADAVAAGATEAASGAASTAAAASGEAANRQAGHGTPAVKPRGGAATPSVADGPDGPTGNSAGSGSDESAAAQAASSSQGASSSSRGGSDSEGAEDGGTPSGSQGGGGSHGGGESPPAPSGGQPEKALVAASLSAGEGAQGGVVGVGVGGSAPEAEVTLGSNQVVGDHPPSQGTGITLGGQFLHPPPSIPVLPG